MTNSRCFVFRSSFQAENQELVVEVQSYGMFHLRFVSMPMQDVFCYFYLYVTCIYDFSLNPSHRCFFVSVGWEFFHGFKEIWSPWIRGMFLHMLGCSILVILINQFFSRSITDICLSLWAYTCDMITGYETRSI